MAKQAPDSVWQLLETPLGIAAIESLALKYPSHGYFGAKLHIKSQLLYSKDQLANMVARNAWDNPVRYDAAVAALSLLSPDNKE